MLMPRDGGTSEIKGGRSEEAMMGQTRTLQDSPWVCSSILEIQWWGQTLSCSLKHLTQQGRGDISTKYTPSPEEEAMDTGFKPPCHWDEGHCRSVSWNYHTPNAWQPPNYTLKPQAPFRRQPWGQGGKEVISARVPKYPSRRWFKRAENIKPVVKQQACEQHYSERQDALP